MHWDKSSYVFSGQPTRQEKVMYLETVWAAITNGCVTMVAEDQPVQSGLEVECYKLGKCGWTTHARRSERLAQA